MKLIHLLNIANQGYPDQGLSLAYNPEDGAEPEGADEAVGDGLALFIVRELRDTFRPDTDAFDQLTTAAGVLLGAKGDLEEVAEALLKARDPN